MRSLEPRFYAQLREKIGLGADAQAANSYDIEAWPALREKFAAIFAERTRDQCCEVLEGTDSCFAPVLNPDEAAEHPNMRAREAFSRENGMLQSNPAPRFSDTPAGPPGAIPRRGEHTDEVLLEWSAGAESRLLAH